MARFTFARGNASKIVAAPAYLIGALASRLIRRHDDTWVFGSGAGFAEGSRELIEHVRREAPATRVLWLARDRAEVKQARRYRIPVARRSSWRGLRATLRARVLVVTHGLGDVNRYGTRGAFIVQLWHGIPLKRIQLDSKVTFRGPVPAFVLRMLYRRRMRALGLIPAAGELAAQRLRSAFGVAHDTVVVTGDPRNDTVLRSIVRGGSRILLENQLGSFDGAGLVLFAPTWRDGDPDPLPPTDDEWRELAEVLDRTDRILFLRPHPLGVGDYAHGPQISRRIRMLDAAAWPDINRVLPAFDALITDYSSIAYDYALTGKPIVFLAPDLAEYTRTRGLYESYREFSGGLGVTTWAQVAAVLADKWTLQRIAGHSDTLAARHHAFTDGDNTDRVYREILDRLGAHRPDSAAVGHPNQAAPRRRRHNSDPAAGSDNSRADSDPGSDSDPVPDPGSTA